MVAYNQAREDTGTKQMDTQKRRPRDKGGRWEGHHQKPGFTQDCWELSKAGRDEEGFSPEPSEGAESADPFISDF